VNQLKKKDQLNQLKKRSKDSQIKTQLVL